MSLIVNGTPAAGGDAGTHTSGTLAALPASPVAGDTYAVTSGAGTGSRYTCFVTGTWEGTMPFIAGHTWERLAAATAGAGARFLDTDTGVTYTSSGDNAIGWYVELGSGLGADRKGLALNAGNIVEPVCDLSAYAINTMTASLLVTFNGTVTNTYAALLGVGADDGASGFVAYLRDIGGGDVTLVVIANGGLTTLRTFVGGVPAGLHSLCLAAVDVAGTDTWRWSWDGADSAGVAGYSDTAMTADYVTPSSTAARIGFGVRPDGIYPFDGKVHDLAIWSSALSTGNITAASALPGTPTYRLPIASGMGAPAIRVEANRYDSITPLYLRAKGLPAALAVSSAVREILY